MFSCELTHPKARVLFFAAGSDGDIHPHLGLAAEMAARGHGVLFFTSFDYLDLARSCGLEAIGILDECDQDIFYSTQSFGPVGKLRARCDFFARKVSEICESVASRLDERSILIAPPFACPLAKLLHLRYGIPYVSTVLAPANLCSRHNPPAFKSGQWFASLPWPVRDCLFHGAEALIFDPCFRWLLRDLLRSMNVPAPHRVLSEWSFSPQMVLALFPEWLCPRAADWPMQLAFAGFPLFDQRTGDREPEADLLRFLDAGPPPVVFTAGTEAKTVQGFFEVALLTAQSLGGRAIFLSRHREQLPVLPDSIHHASYASLELLLPRAAAIVHHGGIGTVAQAMRAGTPQLILPGRLDQFDNAQHVERLGCGLAERNLSDSKAATEKVRRLLEAPEIIHACRSWRDRMVPGPKACSRAADLIEELWHTAPHAGSAPGAPIQKGAGLQY